jgi:hypothetical protein
MTDLGDSLQRMTFAQLALMFAFLTSYVLALGGMLSTTWRRHCAVLALVCAVGFAACTDPWVHGALLMVFVVAGLGLFVMLSWLLARLFSPTRVPVSPQLEQPVATMETPPAPSGTPQQLAEAPGAHPQGTVGAMR